MASHKRSVRGSLIKGILENIPSESYEIIAESIEKTMKGESGIYALYDKDKLYYVGLARNLKGRVKQHTRDRHAKKWDNFSIYIIRRKKFLGDVETILLRIIEPTGNRMKGRIPKLDELRKVLLRATKEKEREAKKTEAIAKKDRQELKKLKMALKPTKRKKSKKTVKAKSTKTRHKKVISKTKRRKIN